MKKGIIIIALLAMIAAPRNSWAWGKLGHNLVAEIANEQLDEATRKQVKEYLGNTSFDDASTWMDEMRSDHSYDYMKPWHYVNIPKGESYVANSEENVVNEINKVIAELQHRDKLSKEEVKKDIMILFHLVGDLHQPLHQGYKNDKGGNDIKVTFMGRESNLHKVWDTDILENQSISLKDCLKAGKKLPKDAVEGYKKIDVAAWVNENRPMLTDVYNYNGNNIDPQYVMRNVPIIEKQIYIGGIRLAAILELCFKS
jgi:S1/P1 Nuclease